MKGNRTTRLRVCIVAVAVIALLTIAAGVGAADELDIGNETESYVIEIDDDVRVVDVEMTDRDEMTILLEADQSTQVAITDASQEIDGAIEINQQQMRLPEGQTEVQFRIANPRQPAVTIATTEGMVGLGDQDFSPDRPAVQWSTVQLLLAMTAIGSGGLVLRFVRKRQEDEKPASERIL